MSRDEQLAWGFFFEPVRPPGIYFRFAVFADVHGSRKARGEIGKSRFRWNNPYVGKNGEYGNAENFGRRGFPLELQNARSENREIGKLKYRHVN